MLRIFIVLCFCVFGWPTHPVRPMPHRFVIVVQALANGQKKILVLWVAVFWEPGGNQ